MYFKRLVILSCLILGYPEAIKPATTPISGTAILPVHLKTTLKTSNVKVKWTFYGTPVISYESGKLKQGENYKDRAFLFDEEEISKGNVSLKLMNVTEKDAGKYKCTVGGENNKFVFLDILIHVTATVNGTAILPVHLKTKLNKSKITVEWKFSDITVSEFLADKTMIYKERVSFFEGEIAEGNISLKLVNIKEEDFGNYTCIFHDENNDIKQFFSFLVKAPEARKVEDVTTQPPQNDPDQTSSRIWIVVAVAVAVVAVVGAALYIQHKRKTHSSRPAAEPQVGYNPGAPEGNQLIMETQAHSSEPAAEPQSNDNSGAPERNPLIDATQGRQPNSEETMRMNDIRN